MYSPKIPEPLVHELYVLRRMRRQPMTKLVAEAIERYLDEQRPLLEDNGSIEPPSRPLDRDMAA